MSKKLSISDLQSIIESLLFTIGRPLSVQEMARIFHTEKVPVSEIKQALSSLDKKYQSSDSGIELKEVTGAWQLRTKEENKDYVRRLVKGRLFQLSAPALEVLVIVAYRQPCKKADIDEIRGVESGHLLRTLMEKNLVCFGPKSTDPGRYITYKTTARFLEVFGLNSLKELPASEDVQELFSSENENNVLDTGLKEVANDLQGFKESSVEQRNIEKELDWVSEEIGSVKSKVKWNEKNT